MEEKLQKKHFVKTYECNRNGDLRILALMNIFQDITERYAYKFNMGIDFCRKKGLAWVATNYHIRLKQRPSSLQKVKITSWTSKVEKLFAIKEFLVTDLDGNILIEASSRWILIDIQRKRPVDLADNLPHHPIIEEKLVTSDFSKIEEVDIENSDFKIDFYVRLDDIDFNQHVNNSLYPIWANEAVHPDFRKDHTPVKFEIAFKKEAFYGETIWIYTKMNGLVSTHSLRSNKDNREVARLRITWE